MQLKNFRLEVEIDGEIWLVRPAGRSGEGSYGTILSIGLYKPQPVKNGKREWIHSRDLSPKEAESLLSQFADLLKV